MLYRKNDKGLPVIEAETDIEGIKIASFFLDSMYTEFESDEKPKQHKCYTCFRVFKSKQGLATHKARAHGKKWRSGRPKKSLPVDNAENHE